MKKLMMVLSMLSCTFAAQAMEIVLEPVQVETSVPAVERGVATLMDTCHGCHSMKYIRYRDLVAFGIAKEKVDVWRGDQPMDAPMTSQMSDDAGMQSFGKIPPDLSLISRAREGGASYVYTYLTGYYNTTDGMTSNHVFPETKMPDPFGISGETDLAKRAEIQTKVRDVVSFLVWASDPHEEERYRLGYYVMGYLLVLTSLLYIVKNQVWAKLK